MCILTVTTVYCIHRMSILTTILKTTDLTAPAETACFASDSGIDASSRHSLINVYLILSPAAIPPAAWRNIGNSNSKQRGGKK